MNRYSFSYFVELSDEENNLDDAQEELNEEDIKVFEVTEGAVDEKKWREELEKDSELTKAIQAIGTGETGVLKKN
ncbi:hypothetical protein NDU88_008724 [Pleurodeles waltl]|uniref:Uncharacterized protein n=1 Tax=Pleurodeles waltl TaxID=8319 RepID=A0AAV7RT82_PLEWA|nr:hypothetical protein NDU88_008724 [Pleurodeles waltl]